jgi:hypothetical protein
MALSSRPSATRRNPDAEKYLKPWVVKVLHEILDGYLDLFPFSKGLKTFGESLDVLYILVDAAAIPLSRYSYI